jgi:hypothetical protein
MTSVINLFSNFNDLSKPKTIIDTPSNYNNKIDTDMLKTSLQQGSKFKRYQNKIIKKTEPLNNLEKPYDTNNLKEGFQGLPNLHLNKNGLTQQTANIIDESEYSGEKENIDQLRAEYDATLKEYKNLTANLQGATSNFFDRVNSNNPFLNKTIRFTTGHICYVTNQGVAKYIPSPEIWNSVNVPKDYIQLQVPWHDSYGTPGTPINTKPPLIAGTAVQFGQSFGNEGNNVFVNEMVTNPKSKYIGCYNDKPPVTEIKLVPKMNSSNNVSGFKSYASSIYQNNNGFSGAWAAFDNNTNTFWHSAVSSSTNYDRKTGAYTGTHSINVSTKENGDQVIKGEWLQIEMPKVYSLTKYDLQGRQNCCSTPSGRSPNSWYIIGWDGSKWVEVDKRENQALDQEKKTYFIKDPKPYISYVIITTNCGHPGNRDGNRYCVQISEWTLYTSSEYNFTDSDRAMIWDPNTIGYTDFDTCKKYATENGYTYFSQQGVTPEGTAACLVSNDLANAQKYGKAFLYNQFPLWDSKTTGQNGASAILSIIGSLSVINSEGTSVFSSDNSQAQPGNYLGCYFDQSSRALNPFDSKQAFNLQTCQQKALDGNFSYFGLQNSTSGNNAQCGVSNDLSQALRYGKAGNCTKLSDGTWSGGAWSNAIYNAKTPDSNYFLILEDDGNMCIYRGTGPNDNQGTIWCSQTNGKQQLPNSNFAAANGKYAKNWISIGDTLAAGDFIGSNDGSIYLLMQTDGNLVLYTSTNKSACSANKNGKIMGGSWVNALYEISPSGTNEDIGKIAYINENSELREYDANDVKLANSYTTIKNMNTPNNDIPGAMYGNATIDQCKSTCEGNKDCYGFVFDNRNNVCWPKTSGMHPYGGTSSQLTDVDTYVRERKPINIPFGISDIIKNIDTVLFRNYIKNTGDQQYHGLTNATEVEKRQIAELQKKLDALSSRIAQLSNKFGSNSSAAQIQSKNNISGLKNYLTDLKSTNKEIELSTSNMTRIVNDSDIVVLQKNYSYLFWTILATGTVLVTMNIAKKQ